MTHAAMDILIEGYVVRYDRYVLHGSVTEKQCVCIAR